MVEVIKARCTANVMNISRGRFSRAFLKDKVYNLYVEDDWRSIWGYNEKGIDQMLRDFEISDSFFNNHFEVIQ